jgi:hypothetical protein
VPTGAHCADTSIHKGSVITSGWATEQCTKDGDGNNPVTITLNVKENRWFFGRTIGSIDPITVKSAQQLAAVRVDPPCTNKDDQGQCVKCVWDTTALNQGGFTHYQSQR